MSERKHTTAIPLPTIDNPVYGDEPTVTAALVDNGGDDLDTTSEGFDKLEQTGGFPPAKTAAELKAHAARELAAEFGTDESEWF